TGISTTSSFEAVNSSTLGAFYLGDSGIGLGLTGIFGASGTVSAKRTDGETYGVFTGARAAGPGRTTITPPAVAADVTWSIAAPAGATMRYTFTINADGLVAPEDLDRVVLMRRDNSPAAAWTPVATRRIGSRLTAIDATIISHGTQVYAIGIEGD